LCLLLEPLHQPFVVLIIFGIDWACLDHDLPICASPHNWDDWCTSLHPTIGWDRVLWTFHWVGLDQWSSWSLPLE
jgi:hypothetical protein